MSEILAFIAMAAGVVFMLIAALGLWLLPDFYMRIHAPTKAATLGLFFLILAFVLSSHEQGIPFNILLVLLFVGGTIPIGSHILARAAYRAKTQVKATISLDEYKDQAQ